MARPPAAVRSALAVADRGAFTGVRSWLVAGVALVGLAAAGCAHRPADDAGAIAALLRQQTEAHRRGDVAAFVATLADPFASASDGTWTTLDRAALTARFSRYFAASAILAWDDRAPPVIDVAGELATAALSKRVQVRDRVSGDVETVDFAWLARFRRVAGAWRQTAIASTRVAVPPRTWPELRALYHGWLGADWSATRRLTTTAQVTSPRGPFTAQLSTSLDGRACIVRTFPDRTIRLDVDDSRGSERRDAATRTLPPNEVAVAHWHDALAFALRPDRFLAAPGAVENVHEGDVRYRLAARGPAGEPVRTRFAADGRLLGYALDGVDISIDAWQPLGDLRVPRIVTFHDAGGDWTYRFAAPTALSTLSCD